jgi:predicted transcriptional regulator
MRDQPILHVRVPDYIAKALDDLTAALASSGYAAEGTLTGQLTRAQVIRLAIARGMAELAREAARAAKNDCVFATCAPDTVNQKSERPDATNV